MTTAPRRKPKPIRPRLCPGLFAADPALPADSKGRHVCARCGRVGEPGDVRHPAPKPLSPAAAAAYAAHHAARLGERDQ